MAVLRSNVNSGWIDEVSYDTDEEMVKVVTNDGSEMARFGVTLNEYLEFVDADSAGTYWHQNLKNRSSRPARPQYGDTVTFPLSFVGEGYFMGYMNGQVAVRILVPDYDVRRK